MLLMPLVHFLAIPGMIWLDHSLELVFLFQDGVETWLSANVTAIIFSSNYPPIGTSGPSKQLEPSYKRNIFIICYL